MADDKAAALLNSVTPDSTTAQLAGAVPVESAADKKKAKKKAKKKNKKKATAGSADASTPAGDESGSGNDEPTSQDAVVPETTTETPAEPAVAAKENPAVAAAVADPVPTPAVDAPGRFPATPASELDNQVIGVNPLPAANGAVNPIKLEAGEEVPKASAEDITKNVKLDQESYENAGALPDTSADKPISVNPLPAAVGALNPIKLEAGDEIPKTEAEDVTKNVKLDKESYENADSLPAGADADADKPISVNPLPAAVGAVNPINLAAGEEVPTPAAEDIAKNVKLDQESYEKADALPEADDLANKTVSINPLPAADTALNPIKLAPGEEVPKASAEEINKNVKLDKESYENADTLPGLDKDTYTLPPVTGPLIPESSLPIVAGGAAAVGAGAAIIGGVTPESTTAKLAAEVPKEPAAAVPEVVKESLAEAGQAPEAAGVAAEVEEKTQLESELLKKVPEAPAAAGAAIIGGVTPASTTAALAAQVPREPAAAVPEVVKESLAEASKAPEAAGVPAVVEEKKEVEAELKQAVEPAPAAAETTKALAVENRPVEETPAAVATTTEPPTAEKPAEVAAAAADKTTTPGVPAATAVTNGESSVTKKKKKNRLSTLFSKIKQKLKE